MHTRREQHAMWMAWNGKPSVIKLAPWKSFKHESCFSHLRQWTEAKVLCELSERTSSVMFWCLALIWPRHDGTIKRFKHVSFTIKNGIASCFANIHQVQTVSCKECLSKVYINIVSFHSNCFGNIALKIPASTRVHSARKLTLNIQEGSTDMKSMGRGHFLKWIYGSPADIYIYRFFC